MNLIPCLHTVEILLTCFLKVNFATLKVFNSNLTVKKLLGSSLVAGRWNLPCAIALGSLALLNCCVGLKAENYCKTHGKIWSFMPRLRFQLWVFPTSRWLRFGSCHNKSNRKFKKTHAKSESSEAWSCRSCPGPC